MDLFKSFEAHRTCAYSSNKRTEKTIHSADMYLKRTVYSPLTPAVFSPPPVASLQSKFPICCLAFCIDVNAAKFISKFLLNFHFHLTTGPQQAPWRNETRVEAALERAVTLLHLARINLPVKANCVNLRYSELYSSHVLHDILLWSYHFSYHEEQCNRLETC